VVHLTLTDDHPFAQAFVVIEAVTDDTGLTSSVLARGGSSV
jgi:hypothetical protein